MSLPAGLISLPCEGAMHVSCWVGSSCSGMAGQTLHGGTTCFQHILLAPACPSCMDMAPWPTSRNFPPVPWSHLGGPGAPFVPLAASPEGWAWFELKPQSSIALGPNMDWLSLGGYRTKTITFAYLRKSLGYQVKHFPPRLPLCRLGRDLYFPKELGGRGRRTESDLEKRNCCEKPQTKPRTAPSRFSQQMCSSDLRSEMLPRLR